MAGISWSLVGTEIAALGALIVTRPLTWLPRRRWFDPTAAHPTPVVLLHGLLGAASDLFALRATLRTAGVTNCVDFAYEPRLDHERLADRLTAMLDRLRETTGVARVDVVGHSLGGLVARRVIERSGPSRIRRLVSIGSPYFARALPRNELAIFGAHDPFIPTPRTADEGRVVVVPGCGHWGLLFHPLVSEHTAGYLTAARDQARPAVVPLRAPLGPRAGRAAQV